MQILLWILKLFIFSGNIYKNIARVHKLYLSHFGTLVRNFYYWSLQMQAKMSLFYVFHIRIHSRWRWSSSSNCSHALQTMFQKRMDLICDSGSQDYNGAAKPLLPSNGLYISCPNAVYCVCSDACGNKWIILPAVLNYSINNYVQNTILGNDNRWPGYYFLVVL